MNDPTPPSASEADRALAEKFLFVFDVESIGLHGEGFSVGWVVVKNGAEFEASYVACDRALAKGADVDRAWVEKNVPAQAITHSSPLAVRDAFWRVWRQWQANGAVMVADCAWPVEARFLAQCVDDAPSERAWDGPYPLHDAASLLLAFGKDPLATNERLHSEKPAHNPLCDARQTARLIHEAARGQAAHVSQRVAEAVGPLEKELAKADSMLAAVDLNRSGWAPSFIDEVTERACKGPHKGPAELLVEACNTVDSTRKALTTAESARDAAIDREHETTERLLKAEQANAALEAENRALREALANLVDACDGNYAELVAECKTALAPKEGK